MSKNKKPTINDIEWTDHVLELLSDDEKIQGNPTTDGLRRIFEIALDCTIIDSSSHVAQTPDLNNGNRATVIHSLTYILNNKDLGDSLKTRTVDGSADVYWGNCDKIFRNHPVAVAETRAEGRALRRGLRLRKVVAAEEIADEIEDDIDGNNVGKMTNNQLNFMDVLCKRLDINPIKYLESMNLSIDTDKLDHNNGVSIIRQLSSYQQDTSNIPETILGYEEGWK